MAMTNWGGWAAAVAALSVVACGSDDDGNGCVAPQACDITQADCQQAVFAATACERQQEGAPLPSIRTQSVEDFRRQQQEELEAESSTADASWEAALQLLGLLPPNQGVVETYVDMQADGVAAYYSDESKRVTVLDRDDRDPVSDVFVLSHEFVHSLQDTDVGLTAFIRAHVVSTDSSLAIRTLIEGEATIVSFAVMERARGRPPERANWTSMKNNLMSQTRDDFSSSESPFLLGYQALPYAYGFAALQSGWLEDETRQLEGYYAEPYTSFADLTLPLRQGGSLNQALECYPTDAPPGFVADDHDSFGLLAPMAYERTFTGTIGIDTGWRGDSVVIFRSETNAGSYAAAWTTRWRDQGMASAFAERLIGRVPAATVTRRSEEVDVLVATDASVLAAWTPGCGTKDGLPGTGSQTGTEERAGRLSRLLSRLRLH